MPEIPAKGKNFKDLVPSFCPSLNFVSGYGGVIPISCRLQTTLCSGDIIYPRSFDYEKWQNQVRNYVGRDERAGSIAFLGRILVIEGGLALFAGDRARDDNGRNQ